MATVQSLDATKVITVRTTGFDPAASSGGSAFSSLLSSASSFESNSGSIE